MKRTARKINRLLLLVLLLAVIFPFTFPMKEGRPLLSWRDIKLPQTTDIKLPDLSTADTTEAQSPESPQDLNVILYRWRDRDGGLQFSNLPPPQGVDYEIIEVSPEANLVQGLKSEDDASTKSGSETKAGLSFPTPLSVSPEEATQLLEDARKIRAMSEERLRQQEALTR